MQITLDHLAIETSQRLYGLSALIDMVYSATPEVELRVRDELKQLAENENWDYSDYSAEDQNLDVEFKHWLPKLAAYSIIDRDRGSSCPLAQRSRLLSGFCSSARTFAPRFLQTPPRADALALR